MWKFLQIKILEKCWGKTGPYGAAGLWDQIFPIFKERDEIFSLGNWIPPFCQSFLNLSCFIKPHIKVIPNFIKCLYLYLGEARKTRAWEPWKRERDITSSWEVKVENVRVAGTPGVVTSERTIVLWTVIFEPKKIVKSQIQRGIYFVEFVIYPRQLFITISLWKVPTFQLLHILCNFYQIVFSIDQLTSHIVCICLFVFGQYFVQLLLKRLLNWSMINWPATAFAFVYLSGGESGPFQRSSLNSLAGWLLRCCLFVHFLANIYGPDCWVVYNYF